MAPFRTAFSTNSLYPSNWPSNPFHKGEVAVQKRLGTHDEVMSFAPRFIRPYMPDQHRQFYEAQPFLVIAARDQRGKMWSTIMANGSSSVTTSPDPKTLRINAQPVKGDALANELKAGSDIGILGIEFATKRRNRVSGRLATTSTTEGAGMVFKVDQSFGNCPQYIKPRQWWIPGNSSSKHQEEEEEEDTCPLRSDHLSKDQIEQIHKAETIFLATGYRDENDPSNDVRYGNDASHRGGPAGFAQVVDQRTLILPDFPGNQMFNSIGNLEMDERIGISFPQFEAGSMIQVTGRARVEFDSNKAAEVDASAERLIIIEVDEVVDVPEGSLPLRWSYDMAELQERKLVVSARIKESDDVMSFHLRPQDHELQSLWDFQPGQHLPISLSIDPFNKDAKLERTYSISSGPGWGEYRISVRRQGKASSFLHNRVHIGDVLQVQKPAGDFVLNEDSNRPLVLLSSGIGVTPMIAMLHRWLITYLEKKQRRPLFWIHGARDGEHHPFVNEVEEIRRIVRKYDKDALTTHVAYSQPLAENREHDSEGRLTVDKLQNIVGTSLANAEIYMCGSDAFVADMEEGLTSEAGVPSGQIHYETF